MDEVRRSRELHSAFLSTETDFEFYCTVESALYFDAHSLVNVSRAEKCPNLLVFVLPVGKANNWVFGYSRWVALDSILNPSVAIHRETIHRHRWRIYGARSLSGFLECETPIGDVSFLPYVKTDN